jgi:FdhD protein
VKEKNLSPKMPPSSKSAVHVWAFQKDLWRTRRDQVATEEPMEIRLSAGTQIRTVAVTMRTPGADFELAAGFLFAEGIVRDPEEILQISYCTGSGPGGATSYNTVTVELRGSALPPLEGMERHFYVNSACGVCGKASLQNLLERGCRPLGDAKDLLRITPARLLSLPRSLREAQRVFQSTGGLHAAALFDLEGNLLALREDVGRHNAMDKLLGWAFLGQGLPLKEKVVLVSGRASFELLQKAVAAEVPIFCAVSAPSSLAVEVAREFGVTLVGFLREDRFNVYSVPERVLDKGIHAEGMVCGTP